MNESDVSASTSRSRNEPGVTSDDAVATVFYDGQCPFCSAYVRLLRLRESVGEVILVDARQMTAATRDLVERGIDLNEGMALKIGGRVYHGDECVHALAMLTTSSRWFNRLNGMLFSSGRRARIIYPMMRAGRNAGLWLLRRKKLDLRDPERASPGRIHNTSSSND